MRISRRRTYIFPSAMSRAEGNSPAEPARESVAISRRGTNSLLRLGCGDSSVSALRQSGRQNVAMSNSSTTIPLSEKASRTGVLGPHATALVSRQALTPQRETMTHPGTITSCAKCPRPLRGEQPTRTAQSAPAQTYARCTPRLLLRTSYFRRPW